MTASKKPAHSASKPAVSNLTAANLPVIGWREKVALPELAIPAVKVKVDTGARSSALHAFDIEIFKKGETDFVRFKVHPIQRSRKKVIVAEAALLDMREVRNSGGKAESRPVISTLVSLGGEQWPIELTLTDRDQMGFRMLLGRQAVRRRFLVDAGGSYVQGSLPARKLKSRKKSSKSSRKKLDENSNLVEKFLSLFDASS
ncbi:MAG: RimK/LysX family protein [Phormidesmis sp.]